MLSITSFLPFSFFPSLTLCYSLRTLSHTLSHCPLLSLSLTLPFSQSLSPTLTLHSLSHSHTHLHTPSFSPSLPFSLSLLSYRNIAAGEALSYDYQFDTNEEDIFKCYCQAYNCRGTMAPRKKMNKVIVAWFGVMYFIALLCLLMFLPCTVPKVLLLSKFIFYFV